ncbi:SOS response-associated peptidase [Segetibacter aerophilus]|uniref:Abasic site processing protein n=1 Tax=Segetibacter aerophilus TaxID=670293 RepID=A0A512B9X6_9BACT|nr:SOS response-associated peptidase family protein [Segetibacter aerophilus]GEO08739.1 hypothetical protein SAE01_12350 [Segetibacter aerophilus]
MCNYKGMKLSRNELMEKLKIERQLEESHTMEIDYQSPIHNGFDYKKIDIVVPEPDCKWTIAEMEWGFIPEYWWTRKDVENHRRGFTDSKGVYHPQMTTLNAKGEDLLKPGKMYRDAALHRRCLFPATEFYEWRHIFPLGKKGQPLKTPVKYPYHIAVKNKEVFLIAGIWQTWTDRETGETVDTCANITTVANSIMAQVHNSKKRMPVILTEQLANEWISEGLSEQRITEIATFQLPSKEIDVYPIRKDFLTALDPSERFQYEGLSELVYEEEVV